jgi:hypothetical protein
MFEESGWMWEQAGMAYIEVPFCTFAQRDLGNL